MLDHRKVVKIIYFSILLALRLTYNNFLKHPLWLITMITGPRIIATTGAVDILIELQFLPKHCDLKKNRWIISKRCIENSLTNTIMNVEMWKYCDITYLSVLPLDNEVQECLKKRFPFSIAVLSLKVVLAWMIKLFGKSESLRWVYNLMGTFLFVIFSASPFLYILFDHWSKSVRWTCGK